MMTSLRLRENGSPRSVGLGLFAVAAAATNGGCTPELNTDGDAEISGIEQGFSNQRGGPSASFPGHHCVGVGPLGDCEPIHEQITVEALWFLKEDVRNFVALSNATYDALHVLDARAHFDNCTFRLSSGRVIERYEMAIANAKSFPSTLSCPTYFADDCSASGEIVR